MNVFGKPREFNSLSANNPNKLHHFCIKDSFFIFRVLYGDKKGLQQKTLQPVQLKYGLLIHYFHTHEECARLCGTIKISRVAELAFVEVLLETVEDILYTGVQLQLNVVAQHKCIV